jgi:Domain of unknown function (DUF4158)
MEHAFDLDLWTLSPMERGLIATKSKANPLTFALLLKYFGLLGHFPPSIPQIDHGVVLHVARQLGIDVASNGVTLGERTLERYRAEVRVFFGFRETTVEDGEQLTAWLCDHAVAENRDHDRLAAALLIECRRRSLEPPASDRADRIVRAAVHAYEERFFAHTCARLSSLTRARLDALLQPADGTSEHVDESTSAPAVINTLRRDVWPSRRQQLAQ